MNYGTVGREDGNRQPSRRQEVKQIGLVFTLIAVALTAAICIVAYSRVAEETSPISAFQILAAGNEYTVSHCTKASEIIFIVASILVVAQRAHKRTHANDPLKSPIFRNLA
jgi:hypothetical protein